MTKIFLLGMNSCNQSGEFSMINNLKLDQDAAITDHSQEPERIFYVAIISVLEHGNEREIYRLFSVPEDNIESASVIGEATTYDSFSGDAEWNGAAGSWFFSEELTIMCEQMRKVPPECIEFLKELFQDSTPDQKTIDLVESLLQGKEV